MSLPFKSVYEELSALAGDQDWRGEDTFEVSIPDDRKDKKALDAWADFCQKVEERWTCDCSDYEVTLSYSAEKHAIVVSYVAVWEYPRFTSDFDDLDIDCESESEEEENKETK